ncbi:hypothetical protein BGZ47_008714 [Haplosporangium gracile]|nr:hypothetical protein BGZ47_008714 [Haplosporangium gracile]
MSDLEHDDHSSMDVWEDEGGDNDDVWGNDDEVSYDRAIAQKEWDRLHENFGNYVRSSSSQLSQIKDKEGWITRATQVVKELVELDIAKVFDKAFFDGERGPSSSSSNKEEKDSGCCGGSADGSNGSSCCQKKGEDVDAGSQAEPETLESSTPLKDCCGGREKGQCQSNKSNSCKSEKKDDEKTVESECSSKPEQVINEYRSRVRALLLEANMEALSQTA